MGFTKLFSSILLSSIWMEDQDTRLVWITLLALANRKGVVEASGPGIANAARVSIEACDAALKKFQEPDEDSRSEQFEGRRIQRVEGGWLLLNYARYRATLSESDRTDYQRIKQAEYRAKKKVKSKGPLPGEPAYEKAALAGDEKEMERVLESRLPEDPNVAAKALVAEAKGMMREIRAERRAENAEQKAVDAEAFRQRTLAKMKAAAEAELPPEPEGLPADEQPAPGVIPEL
jgi:hypothetical protein